MDFENPNKVKNYEEVLESNNYEISINYLKEKMNCENIVVNNMFSYEWLFDITNDDYEPHFINECKE